jgi:peptidoglycan/LPS O-acetylase OafA/YrhL
MHPTDILPAIICVAIAFITAKLLARFDISVTTDIKNHYATIDGLRGFLAFFVFLHHSCIWYFYLKTGGWGAPPSSLYAYFGTASVMMFFMVTALLFFSKLIVAKDKGIDWCRLYTSRLLRLVPLYLFVVLVVFIIAAYLTKGELNTPVLTLVHGMLGWLRFWDPKMPDLNGIENSSLVVAAVFWTLPFEWGFYFILPLFAMMLGIKPRAPVKYLVIMLLGVHILMKDVHQLAPFVFGIATAYAMRNEHIKKFSNLKMISLLIVPLLMLSVVYFPNPRDAGAQVLLFLAFCFIACGNDLFGILTNKLARLLGEISYSIYMLHGVVLFVTFNFVIGLPAAKSLTPTMYCLVIFAISPILIGLSFITYRVIEYPAITSTTKLTAWFYSWGKKISKA